MQDSSGDKPVRFKASTFMPLDKFINAYMDIYKQKGTNKDLAIRLGIDLRRVYVLRDHANKVLLKENVQLPKLYPYDRRYGNGSNPKELASIIRSKLDE